MFWDFDHRAPRLCAFGGRLLPGCGVIICRMKYHDKLYIKGKRLCWNTKLLVSYINFTFVGILLTYFCSRSLSQIVEFECDTQSVNKRLESRRGANGYRWLHVPKTGSSFINTLFLWTCPDMQEGTYFQGHFLNDSKILTKQCRQNIFQTFAEDSDGPRLSISGPMNQSEVHKPLPRILSMDDLSRTFTLLREPRQRLLSHYLFGHRHKSTIDSSLLSSEKICSFARKKFPGLYVRMIAGLGNHLSNDTSYEINHVLLALHRVRHLGFVGVTEEWTASMCLFHSMHGGKMYNSELVDINHNPLMDSSEVQRFLSKLNCSDVVDELIYSEGRKRFRADLDDHPHCKSYLLSMQ